MTSQRARVRRGENILVWEQAYTEAEANGFSRQEKITSQCLINHPVMLRIQILHLHLLHLKSSFSRMVELQSGIMFFPF